MVNMVMLGWAKCIVGLAGLLTALPTAALPFSGVRLILLIAWMYGCLYSVQRIQHAGVVPKVYQPLVSLVSLFVGPVVLLVVASIEISKKASEEERALFETMKEYVRDAIKRIKYADFGGAPSNIKLLDTSGRSIKEIYGHGKTRKQDRRVLDLTEELIADAIDGRASDILIDPKGEASYAVRFRVDGMLRTIEHFESATAAAVINSIKAVSSMDIAEKRRAQDGAFVAKTADGTVSFRVASAGVLNGEKLSIRVLNQNAGLFTLENIGLTQKQRAVIEVCIAKPTGMILINGPTGSGKTTTMYGMLNKIDLFTRNVITIEDPIEYVLCNASQIEVNPKAGITFAGALRNVLRQDPDVICVGEIRDDETAGMALRASQTGHLVLATVHSESNASALVRLLDLGVSTLLLSSGLSFLVSQRLLRVLCRNCKVKAQLSQQQINDLRRENINYSSIYQPVGCEHCDGTGYHGRTAIFDLLVITDALKSEIATNPALLSELRKNGDLKGQSNLHKQGMRKVVSGLTSLDEIKRVLG